jgi:beta-glucanase (GH16 family)
MAATLLFAASGGNAQDATSLAARNSDADVAIAAPAGTPTLAEEFNRSTINPDLWRFDTSRNKDGWYNGELQYYAHANTPANARIDKGSLVIQAQRNAPTKAADWGRQRYSAARLVLRKATGYGFYEVRAKLPCGRGIWPAIWMVPPDGQWPNAGEIDIMEMVGVQPGIIHATLHSGAYNHRLGNQRGGQTRVATACGAYHRYQLDWRPDGITIGVDGRGYMRIANDQPGNQGAWPFNRPFNLILNVAVGGGWAGARGIDDSAFPQAMRVDYVRYWAR